MMWNMTAGCDALPGSKEARRKKFNVFLVVAHSLNSIIDYSFLGGSDVEIDIFMGQF